MFYPWCSWLCGGATGRDHTWSTITGHSCGRFKEDHTKLIECARRDLYRYMHYHNRYKAHTDSLKQESNLKETIQGKIAISENKESRIKDYSWVINGLNRLFRSRRVLSYSYPFAFYMFGDELFKDEMTSEERDLKQNLFEDQQQQLESNVEKLSMFLEKDFQDFSDEEVMENMKHVINLSSVIDRLCKQMWACAGFLVEHYTTWGCWLFVPHWYKFFFFFLSCRYQCIENDLLYPLQRATHNIAPYKSKGPEKASELSACWVSNQTRSAKNNKMDALPHHVSAAVNANGMFL